jgi:hypothetical protein
MNFWKGVTNSVQRIVGGLVGEILGRSGGSKENEEEDADETEQDEGEDKQNADGEGDVDAAVAVSSLGASWEFETSRGWVSFDTGTAQALEKARADRLASTNFTRGSRSYKVNFGQDFTSGEQENTRTQRRRKIRRKEAKSDLKRPASESSSDIAAGCTLESPQAHAHFTLRTSAVPVGDRHRAANIVQSSCVRRCRPIRSALA